MWACTRVALSCPGTMAEPPCGQVPGSLEESSASVCDLAVGPGSHTGSGPAWIYFSIAGGAAADKVKDV